MPGNAISRLPAQMRQALRNLAMALEESGAAIGDVAKTTVYVASSDRNDLVSAWDEVAAFFGGHDAPSTLLGVTVLGYPPASSSRSRPSPSAHHDRAPADHDAD